jgi:hypothetical protein
LGIPIVQFLVDVLGMRSRFSVVSITKGKNSTFSVVDLCVGILAIIVLECERLSHVDDQFGRELVLAHQLGLKRFFSQSTAHRFINQFQGWHTNQLRRIHEGALRAHGSAVRSEEKVTDFDATTLSVEGRKREGAQPGFNRKAKGKDCYQASAAFCANELITQTLDKGHVHCSQRLETLFLRTWDILGGFDVIRLDSGYFSKETLKFLLDYVGLRFLIAASGNCLGMKEARAYAKAHPKRWKRVGRKQDTFVMNFNDHIIFSGMPIPLRLVLVKRRERIKKVKKGRVHWPTKEYIYGIVTNIPRKEKTPNKVYRFYHKRATIENFFRESRQSFHLGKLPSQKFRGNEAYLWFVALAYNSFAWFKRDVLPKHMQRRTAQTIRRKLNVEADIQLDKLSIKLVFDQHYKFTGTYVYLFQRLNTLKACISPYYARAS